MNNIEEKINNSSILLIDFYAKWCGPCRMLTPLLDDVKEIEVLRIDCDEYPDIARKYGVNNIPYLLIVKKGVIVSKHIGLLDSKELNDWIKEHI